MPPFMPPNSAETAPARLELSLWTVTDEYGKRVRTRYKMTAEEARERFPDDPQIVPGSTEVREVPGNSLYTVATSYDGRLD